MYAAALIVDWNIRVRFAKNWGFFNGRQGVRIPLVRLFKAL